MKVIISDYPNVLGRNLEYERKILEEGVEGCEVVIHAFEDKTHFMQLVEDADAILTAFLPIDKEVLDHAMKLKCIAYNATGYDSTDFEEATRRQIAIIPIGEYCTQEVAEHTLALILAVARGIKHYIGDIDNRQTWKYYSGQCLRRIQGQTLGILGFGRIGRAVAKRALGFGMQVKVYDRWIDSNVIKQLGIEAVTSDEIFETCHIISNHMSQSPENEHFFNYETFQKMKQTPIFINVSRGSSVDEMALIEALDKGWIFGAGLDVLEDERPDLKICLLTNRDNVILTPHAAFYSEMSLKELQTISCENVVHYLKGEYDKVNRIVNEVKI